MTGVAPGLLHVRAHKLAFRMPVFRFLNENYRVNRIQAISLTESIQETRIVHLPPGTRIDNFIVGQVLGEGGFGAVYEVTSLDGRVKHALKIEATNAVPQVLCMEVQLLRTLDQRRFCHFCRTHGKDRKTLPQGTFNYVIMTLVEKSIQELRKYQHCRRNPKPGSALRLAQHRLLASRREAWTHYHWSYRTRRASEDLHARLRDGANTLRKTTRPSQFDTRGRKLDFEARNPSRRAQLFQGCSAEYSKVMDHIDSLRYYDQPNYNKIFNLLRRSLASCQLAERPYDWVDPRWPNVQIKRA
uniref:Protein kinase domain-containing protein n=1 Tax=Acrobeloides nanus TaxID=290746 RepID=A0A914CX20_9BILA